jgi:outer membrane protein
VALAAGSSRATAQQTPPVQPKITQTQLPPRVQLPPPPGQAEIPDKPLTADEAARIALAKQPDVRVARAGIASAQARTQQARSGLLPFLGFDLGYSRVEVLSTEGSSTGGVGGSTGRSFIQPGFQASANLQQLLFDFNHTRERVRQSAAQERAAEANLTRVQLDLVLNVKRAFYRYTEAESLVVVNENNVRNRQSHLDLAQARLKAGLGLPIDVVRAQTAHSAAIVDLEAARNSASQARVELALLVGIDPRTPIRAGDSDEPPPVSTDANKLIEEGLRQRPEVAQAKSNLQSAEHGVSAARTFNSPAIRATAGLVARGQNLAMRNDFGTVGIGIAWDPFDGGLTAGRVKEAKATVDVAKADLKTVELTVTADVAQAFLSLKTAEQRVAAADSEVANAEEAVRLAEGRYRSGVGLFIDVIDAQTALLSARSNRVNAQSGVDQSRAALKRSIGAPIGK